VAKIRPRSVHFHKNFLSSHRTRCQLFSCGYAVPLPLLPMYPVVAAEISSGPLRGEIICVFCFKRIFFVTR
jgi:hypothetical protein